MNRSDQLRQRLLAARARLERVPATGPGELGAPDPISGERWHRGNVIGHLAEMLPFLTAQVRGVLAGSRTVGRDEQGTRERREGIRQGEVLPETELRSEIARGLDQLQALLADLDPADLESRIVYRASAGDRELSLGDFVEANLVGHLEAHLDQLEDLT